MENRRPVILKKMLSEVNAYLPVQPLALVSCAGKDGKPNIITVAAVSFMSKQPPVVGVGIYPFRHSHGLIEETKDFAVNFPTVRLLWETDFIGTGPSGKTWDKFEVTGLTPMKAAKIKSPLIKECPVNLECVLREKLVVGTSKSHDWFIGDVVATHVDEEVLNEKGRADLNKAPVLIYDAGNWAYWSIGKKLEDDGFSRKKPKATS
jgi:flavin reductase (DIM6/NTAB) family NADH-FMN oxidoreductase RutF